MLKHGQSSYPAWTIQLSCWDVYIVNQDVKQEISKQGI